jgi:origin recognition complex subunit 1
LHYKSFAADKGFERRTIEVAQPDKRTATIKDVQEVFRAMQHNPITAYLQECSFHERLMLASLVKCMKREGVEEIKWGEVSQGFLSFTLMPDWANFRFVIST